MSEHEVLSLFGEIEEIDRPTLFDRDAYLCEVRPEPEPELSPSPEPEPTDLQPIEGQLGWDRIQLGRIALAEFVTQIIRLNGSCSIPDGDPGGGIRSDVNVTFPARLFSVQVKGRTIQAGGKVQFDLGPRDGDRKSKYIGRAQFFALAVLNEDAAVTDWYLIPASKLRYRSTLTVTPGRLSKRLRKDWIEPERYRNKWHKLLEAPLTSGAGSSSASTSWAGSSNTSTS